MTHTKYFNDIIELPIFAYSKFKLKRIQMRIRNGKILFAGLKVNLVFGGLEIKYPAMGI